MRNSKEILDSPEKISKAIEDLKRFNGKDFDKRAGEIDKAIESLKNQDKQFTTDMNYSEISNPQEKLKEYLHKNYNVDSIDKLSISEYSQACEDQILLNLSFMCNSNDYQFADQNLTTIESIEQAINELGKLNGEDFDKRADEIDKAIESLTVQDKKGTINMLKYDLGRYKEKQKRVDNLSFSNHANLPGQTYIMDIHEF